MSAEGEPPGEGGQALERAFQLTGLLYRLEGSMTAWELVCARASSIGSAKLIHISANRTTSARSSGSFMHSASDTRVQQTVWIWARTYGS